MTREGGRRHTSKRPRGRTKHHRAWTDNARGSWSVIFTEDHERLKTAPDKPAAWASEDGDAVYLVVPGLTNYVTVDLASYTEQELQYIKVIFDIAFELALPESRKRDESAAKAAEDSTSEVVLDRVYRAIPTLYVRESYVGQHCEELREGYTIIPD